MSNFPQNPYGGGTNSFPNSGANSGIYVQPTSAGFGGGGMGAGMDGGMIQPRTSKLAWLALLLGVLAVILLCIPVVAPTIGAIAVFASIGAIVRISGSEGRIMGKGLAVTGFVTGIISVLLGVSCVVGIGWFGGQIQTYSKGLEYAQAGDAASFNAIAAPGAQVTKEDLGAFVASYQPTLGNFKEAPRSFLQIFKSLRVPAVSTEMNALQQLNPGHQAIPVMWKFDNEDAAVMLVLDQTATPTGAQMGTILDIAIASKTSGVVTRLSDVLASRTQPNAPANPPSP